MSFAKCFEELEVWKEGCRFVLDIYATTQNSQFIKDRDFTAQLKRAAVSIPSNIAEGFEKGSKRDFARYLLMA